MVKISLSCFEAAYVTIGLVNEDIKDDFVIDLCEQANPTSIIALFHDRQNAKLSISVDGSDFHSEYEDERLGTEKFKLSIEVYGDETDGFKIINPGESNSLDARINAFVQKTLDLDGSIIYDKVI